MRHADGRAGDADYGRISWVTSQPRLRKPSESRFSGFERSNRGPYSRHIPVRPG